VTPNSADYYAAPMIIPIGNSTTTGALLQFDEAKVLLGEFRKDIFTMVESKRPLPPELTFRIVNLGGMEPPNQSFYHRSAGRRLFHVAQPLSSDIGALQLPPNV
jgi:hypothetical protein